MKPRRKEGDEGQATEQPLSDQAIADTSQIWPVAEELLGKVDIAGRGVRLLGIGVSGLSEHEPTQLALDGSDRTALASAAAEVRERYGDDAVRPARLADRREKKPEG